MAIKTYLAIITLNVNVPSYGIKRHRVAKWIKKQASINLRLKSQQVSFLTTIVGKKKKTTKKKKNCKKQKHIDAKQQLKGLCRMIKWDLSQGCKDD